MEKRAIEEIDTTITLFDGNKVEYRNILHIDENNLAGEFADHPVLLGYVGTLVARAERAYENAKLDFEVLVAQIDKDIRHNAAVNNVKITEAKIASQIKRDPDFYDASVIKNEAYEQYKLMRALETGLKERGAMLVSLGATIRQELDMTSIQIRNSQ